MQLHPRENFTIVRQIEDHTDSATYYVRAVIRNAKTDAIIQVNGNNYLNLTDKGSQRFSANWLVPADASGQGFWITILTSVYTDSGYTTKSQNYGDRMETYLVQDRMNPNLGGYGGGGGPDIDYVKIRKIVDEVVAERLKEDIQIPKVEIPEFPEVDIETPIKESEIRILDQIKSIHIPQMKDYTPVLEKIKEIQIENKEYWKQNSIEHEKQVVDINDVTRLEIKNSGEEIKNKIKEEVGENLDEMNENIEDMVDKVRIETRLDELFRMVEHNNGKADPRINRLIK